MYEINLEVKVYTWANSLGNFHVRLDRIYVSKSSTKDVSNVSQLSTPHIKCQRNWVHRNGPRNLEMKRKFIERHLFSDGLYRRLWEKFENIDDQNVQWWRWCKVSFKKLIIVSPLLPFIVYWE